MSCTNIRPKIFIGVLNKFLKNKLRKIHSLFLFWGLFRFSVTSTFLTFCKSYSIILFQLKHTAPSRHRPPICSICDVATFSATAFYKGGRGLTDEQAVDRLAFATGWRDFNWGSVILTDETSISSNCVSRGHVYRERGARYDTRYIQRRVRSGRFSVSCGSGCLALALAC